MMEMSNYLGDKITQLSQTLYLKESPGIVITTDIPSSKSLFVRDLSGENLTLRFKHESDVTASWYLDNALQTEQTFTQDNKGFKSSRFDLSLGSLNLTEGNYQIQCVLENKFNKTVESRTCSISVSDAIIPNADVEFDTTYTRVGWNKYGCKVRPSITNTGPATSGYSIKVVGGGQTLTDENLGYWGNSTKEFPSGGVYVSVGDSNDNVYVYMKHETDGEWHRVGRFDTNLDDPGSINVSVDWDIEGDSSYHSRWMTAKVTNNGSSNKFKILSAPDEYPYEITINQGDTVTLPRISSEVRSTSFKIKQRYEPSYGTSSKTVSIPDPSVSSVGTASVVDHRALPLDENGEWVGWEVKLSGKLTSGALSPGSSYSITLSINSAHLDLNLSKSMSASLNETVTTDWIKTPPRSRWINNGTPSITLKSGSFAPGNNVAWGSNVDIGYIPGGGDTG